MRRKFIACSIVLIMIFSSFFYLSNYALGFYLFQDGFESGDTSNWTKISKDNSAVCQVTNSTSNDGSYSLRVSTTIANSWSYISKTLPTGQISFYFSWSMYFTSIPSRDSARLYFVRIKNSADQSLVSVDLNYYSTTGLRQRLLMYQPNISNEVAANITTGQWYSFEINYTVASVGGGADFWVNGVKTNSLSNVNDTGLGQPITAQVGVYWGTGDMFGTYVDSCIIDSSYVIVGTTPPPPATYALTVRTYGTGATSPSGNNTYTGYSNGTAVTINVVSGTLSYWNLDGGASNYQSPITATMTADHTVNVHFTTVTPPSSSGSMDADRYIVWCYNSTHYAARNMTSSLIECISTNASAVINNAIGNLSYPYAGGGIVHIMAGLYSLTSPINVRGYLTLEGDGSESTVLRVAPGSNCNAIQFTGSKTQNEFFLVIRDLQLHGEPTDSVGTGIMLNSTGYGMADWVLSNVYIQKFPVDDLYFNSYNGWAPKITTCTFEFAGRYAIYKSDGEDERIIGNKFLYNTNGIYLGERYGMLAVISNNFFYKNTAFAILINDSSNVISGNTFFQNSWGNNNTYDDIYIQGGSDNQITGNVFSGGTNVRHAVNINASTANNSITGNSFSSSFVSNIILNSGNGTLITDNTGFVTENSGSTNSCINGSWIAHGLSGTPNGQIDLTISGSRLVNATCYVLDPTVIAKNSTHVQIEFLCVSNGTLAPVTPTESKTICWYFEYNP
jgi:hypothetical protein